MANSREVEFQWDITKAMTARGWKAGTAGGYDHKDEYVSELEMYNYRIAKSEEERLRLRLEVTGENCGFTSVSDVRSGKPHDLEKQRLAENIIRINDDDKLHFANGVADRIERDEAMMAQVLDALSDHEKLSMPLLENEETGRQFALLILKLLAGRSSRDSRAE